RQAAVVRHRGWLIRRLLLLTDLLGLLGAFLLAELIFAGTTADAGNPLLETVLFGATLPGWVVVARFYGLYSQDDRRTNHTTVDEVANIFHMVTVSTWLFFAFAWLTGAAHPAIPTLLRFWARAAGAASLGDRGTRRRAGDHRLLARLARARARADPIAEGLVRPDRHRSALLRADRAGRRNQLRRGDPGVGPAAAGARPVIPRA